MGFNTTDSGPATAGQSGAAGMPLPPLPNLKTAPTQGMQGAGAGGQAMDPFQATMERLRPVKDAVDQINQAIGMIAHSGAIPDPSILSQIVAAVNQLLPIAAQNIIQPGQMAAGMPPPPGAPNAGPGGAPPDGAPPSVMPPPGM